MTEPNPWTAYDQRRMARLTSEERAQIPRQPVGPADASTAAILRLLVG